MKKEKQKQPENEEKKQSGEVSRRDFLVGAGSVIVGGAIGAGIAYPLAKGEEGGATVTEVVTKTTEKVSTVTSIAGAGETETVTVTAPGGGTTTVTKTTTTGTGGAIEPWQEPEETFVGVAATSIMGEGACSVDVKNGKIIRIRPLHWDEKYTTEELADHMWQYERQGKTYKPLMKSDINWIAAGYKKRIYSPNRIPYPLKRDDWEPGGDPAKINAQNRGISKYKRISWDELLI